MRVTPGLKLNETLVGANSIGTLNYASEIFLNGLQNSSVSEEYLKDKKELLTRFIFADIKNEIRKVNFMLFCLPKADAGFIIRNRLYNKRDRFSIVYIFVKSQLFPK